MASRCHKGVLVSLDFIIIQLIRPTDQEMIAIETAAPYTHRSQEAGAGHAVGALGGSTGSVSSQTERGERGKREPFPWFLGKERVRPGKQG